MLLQNKRCQQHLRADNAAPHMSTVPQVLLPCCLAPPVETFHPPEWLLERRVSAWIYNLMGSLNLKSCCKYYLLSLHSHLYGGNKGWQESLGSELIFIPTIAVHTNQHPLPDIYCFTHLGSKEEQALWELKRLPVSLGASVPLSSPGKLQYFATSYSLCSSMNRNKYPCAAHSESTYQGSYFLPSVIQCQCHGAVLNQDPAPVPQRCQKVLPERGRAKNSRSKTAKGNHCKDHINISVFRQHFWPLPSIANNQNSTLNAEGLHISYIDGILRAEAH